MRCYKQSSIDKQQKQPDINDDLIFDQNVDLDSSINSSSFEQKIKLYPNKKNRSNSFLVQVKDNSTKNKDEKSIYKKFNKNISGKNISKIKDGFEYAVNWKRVFIDLYRNLEWLNSFAELNELAMHKILKKFSKNFFQDPKSHFKKENEGNLLLEVNFQITVILVNLE